MNPRRRRYRRIARKAYKEETKQAWHRDRYRVDKRFAAIFDLLIEHSYLNSEILFQDPEEICEVPEN